MLDRLAAGPNRAAIRTMMHVRLSDEAAHYIEDHPARGRYRSPSEFVGLPLRRVRLAELNQETEQYAWLRTQATAAAKLRDNDADARYDAL